MISQYGQAPLAVATGGWLEAVIRWWEKQMQGRPKKSSHTDRWQEPEGEGEGRV